MSKQFYKDLNKELQQFQKDNPDNTPVLIKDLLCKYPLITIMLASLCINKIIHKKCQNDKKNNP